MGGAGTGICRLTALILSQDPVDQQSPDKAVQMRSNGTDDTWKHYGAVDPYYGVLTQERFKGNSLDPEARALFFESGVAYVDHLLGIIREQLDASFRPNRTLDFGCGVGRLALPLARASGEVVGVDISPAMLDEARKNAAEHGLDNATFVEADDTLSRLDGTFDFVHSFIVFQHIPRQRGEQLLRRMIELLPEGGVGALQFTYANSSNTPWGRRTLTRAYERVPWLWALRNVVKRQSVRSPLMQMNLYDVNHLLRILHEAGCHKVHLRFTEASHFRHPIYGVQLLFVNGELDVRHHS